MISIVIGGHSRNVGKTSVAAGLIREFRQYSWAALKISSHRHTGISVEGNGTMHEPFAVHEEKDCDGTSDTCRYLAAGASRALWVRIGENNSDAAMRRLLSGLESNPYVIIESNRILRVLQPNLFIMVLRYDIREFKESARKALQKADAVVVVNPASLPSPWEGISEILAHIPHFVTTDPQIIPPELIDFIRSKIPAN